MKFEVTGKAVIYTKSGAKIVDSKVRRVFNSNADTNTFRVKVKEPHILIGGARDVPTDNIYAKNAFHPETVDFAYKYAQTKFFRLTLDLMRLAQWEPIHPSNRPMNFNWFTTNRFPRGQEPDIDFTKSVAEIDAQLYRKYGFTKPMIDFVEARYHDDL